VVLGSVPVAALTGGWIMPGPLLVAWLWSGGWGLAFAHLHPPSEKIPRSPAAARQSPPDP
jgi:hypothetical protein